MVSYEVERTSKFVVLPKSPGAKAVEKIYMQRVEYREIRVYHESLIIGLPMIVESYVPEELRVLALLTVVNMCAFS